MNTVLIKLAYGLGYSSAKYNRELELQDELLDELEEERRDAALENAFNSGLYTLGGTTYVLGQPVVNPAISRGARKLWNARPHFGKAKPKPVKVPSYKSLFKKNLKLRGGRLAGVGLGTLLAASVFANNISQSKADSIEERFN